MIVAQPSGGRATCIAPQVPEPTAQPAGEPRVFDLYADCYPDRVQAVRFELYVDALCRVLEKQFGAADVRCAPQESPLGFGKWKGALSAVARANLPPSGAYVVDTRNEVAAVTFEAIAGAARQVVRGVR